MNSELFISVSQLNRITKSVLDGAPMLKGVYVCGEISNLTIRYSGHIYFSLKDSDCSVRCVMFESNARRLRFVPENGMKVICRGTVSIYEHDGQCQLYCSDLQPDGNGSQLLEFNLLKAKLESEGLFDSGHKKQLPEFPEKICVITSETGAAIHDIINVISRRWPSVELVLVPAVVQGESAPKSLICALSRAQKEKPDVIIIGRGGGSAEDLSAFNDEGLAHRLYSCDIPTVSAVGHETDFTISDFVCDMRAPTPSAAAESAVPDRAEWLSRLEDTGYILERAVYGRIKESRLILEKYICNPYLTDISSVFGKYGELLDRISERMVGGFDAKIISASNRLSAAAASLDALSPVKVLRRGYSIVTRNGCEIGCAAELKEGDRLNIRFFDGSIGCTVNGKDEK